MCCGASRAPLGRGSRVENKMFCAVVNTATYSCLVDVPLRVGGSLCFFELWTTLSDAAVPICWEIIGNVNKSLNLHFPVEFLRCLLLLFPWFRKLHSLFALTPSSMWHYSRSFCGFDHALGHLSSTLSPAVSLWHPVIHHFTPLSASTIWFTLSAVSRPITLSVHLPR